MAKATTGKAAAPVTPAATPPAAADTAAVAETSVVTTESPKSQVEGPSSLEKSLAALGVKFDSPVLGSNAEPGPIEHPEAETQADPPVKADAGQEPSPAKVAAKENVDSDVEGTFIPAEAEAEVNLDADEESSHESTSQWPESAVHEVSKLRQQKRELKTKAAEAVTKLTDLETRLTEAESKLAAEEVVGASERRSVGASGLSDVKTLPELHRRAAEAEELHEWCEDRIIELRENPAAVEHALKANKISLTDHEGAEDFSRDRMEAFLMNTRRKVADTLNKQVPARERYLTVNAESEGNSRKLFPWYQDKSSAEYQLSQQILRAHPEIQQWPDWKIAVGIQVRGLLEMRKEVKQATSSKAQAPKVTAPVIAPRIPGIPATAPVRVDERAAALTRASEKIRSGGSEEDTVGAVSALLRQGR